LGEGIVLLKDKSGESVMSNHGAKFNVLFLGSGNAARSIMAEAILNRDGGEKFNGYSAGIQAKIALDPSAVDLLKRSHFDTAMMRTKYWNEVADDGAPCFDFIFTVCDNAALLPRSMWKGHPVFAHWGIADPAMAQGNESQIRLAYADTFRMLSNRIGIFVNLPLRSLDRLAMQHQLDSIGNKGNAESAIAAA
jgi:arsenate reductase (thioredoxin)